MRLRVAIVDDQCCPQRVRDARPDLCRQLLPRRAALGDRPRRRCLDSVARQRWGHRSARHEDEALARRIEATDRQIDRLVYELYGLTEEEIGIVETASR